MSRKYLNDKYCVRCGRKEACPYLRDNYELLLRTFYSKDCNPKYPCYRTLNIVDIGCGNGRNSEFIKKKGHNVISLDMVNDYGVETTLGQDELPVKDNSVDIILCNYLMMFLSPKERNQLIKEIKRVSKANSIIMLELYPAKDSYAKTGEAMVEMQEQIFKKIGWEKIRYRKGKFIAQKS